MFDDRKKYNFFLCLSFQEMCTVPKAPLLVCNTYMYDSVLMIHRLQLKSKNEIYFNNLLLYDRL